jgi:probable rRNA maturation factor
MIDFCNETDFALDIAPLEAIAQTLSDRAIDLALIGDEAMRELNREARSIDAPTDVLSFPIADFPFAPLGSIAISLDTAKRQAAERGHSAEAEITVLFLHGVLHLLGYDHENDAGEMAAKEAELRARVCLPLALTER